LGISISNLNNDPNSNKDNKEARPPLEKTIDVQLKLDF